MSVVSMSSERTQDDGNNNNVDELSAQEKFEEKFSQALENAGEKAVQTRCNALQAMCEILQHRYMPDYIEDRKVTIQDVAERSLKRGKGAEQGWAAQLSSLLILQLGVDDAIAKALCETLLVTCQDKSVGFAARAKCCTALGLLNFLGTDDTGMGDLLQTMRQFEQIFSGSYLKGDFTPSSAGADEAILHSAALNAWSLLLTIIPGGDFAVMMPREEYRPSMANLMGMLKSPHLEVRMAAGEAIALVLERGRSHDDQFLDEYLDALSDMAKDLATDFHKYRAKKDRKTQRATFRDVLRFIEEDESPEISVRFGQETMIISSWALHHQYTTLCTVIGPGITNHLAENEFLREVLDLGARLMLETTGNGAKQTKMEKVSEKFPQLVLLFCLLRFVNLMSCFCFAAHGQRSSIQGAHSEQRKEPRQAIGSGQLNGGTGSVREISVRLVFDENCLGFRQQADFQDEFVGETLYECF